MLLFVTLCMPLYGSFSARTFTFRFDARTSRGRMKNRRSCFIKLVDTNAPEKAGYGECAPLPGLSIDDVPEHEEVLAGVLEKVEGGAPAGAILQNVREILPGG